MHGRGVGVVATTPVGHHYAVPLPLVLEDVAQQNLVAAGMLAAELVVTAHETPGTALGGGRLEGRQVDLAQGAVAHLYIDVAAPPLLVVQGVVLHTGGHTIALQSLHIGHHHHTGQIGILAHILEVAAVEWGTVDVHTGAEQNVLAAVAGFFAHHASVEQRHLGIPGGCQAGESRKSGARVVGPLGVAPVVPVYLGAHAVGTVAHPYLGYAETRHTGRGEFRLCVAESYFFLEGHP